MHTYIVCIYRVGLEWNRTPQPEAAPGLTQCPAPPTLCGERVPGTPGPACGGTRGTALPHRPRATGHVRGRCPHPGSRPAPSRLCPHSLPMAVAARPRSRRCHRLCRRRHVTRAADGPSLPARGDTAVPPSRSAPRARPQARAAGAAGSARSGSRRGGIGLRAGKHRAPGVLRAERGAGTAPHRRPPALPLTHPGLGVGAAVPGEKHSMSGLVPKRFINSPNHPY